MLRAGAIALVMASIPSTACITPEVSPEGNRAVPEVSIAALVANPGAYMGRPLSVSGHLVNVGTNYFTDLRVVLRDGEGSEIDVIPWLPLSLPPPPPGAARESPATLSSYLDARVRLSAHLQRFTVQGVGEVYALRVTSAERAPGTPGATDQ